MAGRILLPAIFFRDFITHFFETGVNIQVKITVFNM